MKHLMEIYNKYIYTYIYIYTYVYIYLTYIYSLIAVPIYNARCLWEFFKIKPIKKQKQKIRQIFQKTFFT